MASTLVAALVVVTLAAVGMSAASFATTTGDAAPSVTTQPADQVVAVGASASFSAAASGSPTPTVQWQISTNDGSTWSDVAGATSTPYVVVGAAGDHGKQFRAVFTNSTGTATSNAARLLLSGGPVVITQPQSQVAIVGATVTFTSGVGVTSVVPVPTTAQWQVSTNNGTSWSNLTSANLLTYSLTAALSDSGKLFRVVFTNVVGTATSAAATLTVGIAPAVTTQPGDQTVGVGATATFSAAASGTPTPTIQWQLSTTGGATWGDISGATTSPYIAVASSGDHGKRYRAVFTNAFGTATTGGAALYIQGAPVVTTQPANQAVNVGTTASFNAVASGTPAPTVQWQRSVDGGSTWTNIAGATSTTYSFTAALSDSGSQFRAVFTNSVAAATSSAATLQCTVAGNATHVSAGDSVTCAVSSGGGVKCWGRNTGGRLGTGSTSLFASSVPLDVATLATGVSMLSAGATATCAVTVVGSVKCWGYNTYGGLGNGSNQVSSAVPVDVIGLQSGVSQTANGWAHTCAVTAGGGVKCWGYGASGEFGNGETRTSSTPVDTTGLSSGISQVTAGNSHSCALTTTGGVKCWGNNAYGQLGTNSTVSSLVPVDVMGLSSGVVQVSAGGLHTCALMATGGVKCWGRGTEGQLGNNSTQSILFPTDVVGLSSGVTQISAGSSHTCIVLVGGAAQCWGNNAAGQLGNNSNQNSLTPVAVVGLTNGATEISSGVGHTCVVMSAGGVKCWGGNSSGELGNNSTQTSRTPTDVVGLIYGPITIDVSTMPFGATRAVSQGPLVSVTPARTVTLSVSGTPSAWTATSNQSWLQITGGSGVGAGQFSASVSDPTNLLANSATATATITITAPNAPNAPLTIPVTLTINTATSAPPMGVFDTPTGSSALSGSFPVTGWALDDVAVNRVELWRDVVAGETTTPYYGPGHPGNGKIYIANALFVTGSRPDVEQAYRTRYPSANRGGWGYLLLSWGLWAQGNGTYKLYAFAFDDDGNATTLGTKTITVANASATKPFGAIDTPEYGGTASGTIWNYGWALTPNATPTCTITGGNVSMSIDSGALVPVTYGSLRTDIAAAFPGFSNGSTAGGAYSLDTSGITNGVHQIGWYVVDSCGRADGIGSRFFTVLNGGAADAVPPGGTPGLPALSAAEGKTRPTLMPEAARVAVGRGFPPSRLALRRDLDEARRAESGSPVLRQRSGRPEPLSRGGDQARTSVSVRHLGGEWQSVTPTANGVHVIEVAQDGRIEVQLPGAGMELSDPRFKPAFGRYVGKHLVAGELRDLPLGSSLDADAGIFYWQPAPGFLGAYELEFVAPDKAPVHVRVVVGETMRAVIDTPTWGDAVTEAFWITGWALDLASAGGAGIDTVHVWAYPVGGTEPTLRAPQGRPEPRRRAVFLGNADVGDRRADVARLFGKQFEGSAFSLSAAGLDAGTYDIVVYPHRAKTNTFEGAQVVRVVVK